MQKKLKGCVWLLIISELSLKYGPLRFDLSFLHKGIFFQTYITSIESTIYYKQNLNSPPQVYRQARLKSFRLFNSLIFAFSSASSSLKLRFGGFFFFPPPALPLYPIVAATIRPTYRGTLAGIKKWKPHRERSAGCPISTARGGNGKINYRRTPG